MPVVKNNVNPGGIVLIRNKLGGVHPRGMKGTAGFKPVELPVPAFVHIPMSMHSGKPAKVIVKAGDEVKVGQLIGEAEAYVCAPVHSSVSGKVKSVAEIDSITGKKAVTVTIESDGKQTPYEGLAPPVVTDYKEFLAAVRASGVVGLGGAGFPTEVKLTVKNLDKLDYILINGAECEPYITSDMRTMVDDTDYMWEGICQLKKHLKPKEILVCIEDNKPEAIEKVKKLCADAEGIDVRVLASSYPQGERKVMVYNVTKRIVPEGARLTDVGCLVNNCTTAAVIGKYIKTGMPLVSKVITVDGSAVNDPKNVIVPLGTHIKDVFEFCGGLKDDVGLVLFGGPMMGVAAPSLEIPIVKISNAVLAFSNKDVLRCVETPCIRCGRCGFACPMHLSPMEAETAFYLKNPERLETLKVNLCIECGCCAYVCPAKRPLVQVMKLSNDDLWNFKEARKAKG